MQIVEKVKQCSALMLLGAALFGLTTITMCRKANDKRTSYVTVGQSTGARPQTTMEENEIIANVLSYLCKGGFYVIDPHTNFLGFATPYIRNGESDSIKKRIGSTGLVEQLFDKNSESYIIGLKSNDKLGYHVNTDGKYDRFFHVENRKEWLLLTKTIGEISGLVKVSLPVYQKETGIVLIYIEVTKGFSGLIGTLYKFTLRGGQLQLTDQMGVMVS